MIPRVIHYCWFGGSPLPASVDRCLSSWRQFCPGYEIRHWDETSFPVDRCRFSLEAYAAGKWAFVSDYARLRIVFDHGGIYLDTDVELIAPLDRLLPHSAFFGFESRGAIATGLGFGATAGHPLVGSLLAHYESATFLLPDGRPDTTPCPERDATVFAEHGFRLDGSRQERNGAVILPADYLCPKSYESGQLHVTPRTLAIHHYDASWHGAIEADDLARRRRYTARFGPWLGRRLYLAANAAAPLLAPILRFVRSRS